MEEVVRELRTQIEQWRSQQTTLDAALQRAQTAFEQQSVALTETRNESGRVRAEATASSQAATSIGDSR